MKKYNIAGITMEIEDPFEINNFPQSDKFLVEEKDSDYKVRFVQKKEAFEWIRNSTIVNAADYYFILNADVQYIKAFHHGGNIYAITVMDSEKKESICYFSDYYMMKYKIEHGYTSMMYIELERILLRYRAFILHSSYISYKQQAILFSAPSGTGKSTQAELWKVNEGAEIINGDRAAIRKYNGRWMACGLPICGTSNICQNVSTPLSAIVIIKQAMENSVQELKAIDIFKAIYSETTVNRWDETSVNLVMGIIQEMANEIPVVRLNCTKDKEAVDVLKTYLIERQILKDA